MVGNWKKSKKWFKPSFYNMIFQQDTGFLWIITMNILFCIIFLSHWEDLGYTSSGGNTVSVEIMTVNIIMNLGVLIWLISMNNPVIDRGISNRKEVAKNSIFEIIPLKNEECIRARFIYLNIVVCSILGCFLITYLLNFSPQLNGVRGIIAIFVVITLANTTFVNLSMYNAKLKKIEMMFSKFRKSYFIGCILLGAILVIDKSESIVSKIIVDICFSDIAIFLGNDYISLILVVATIIVFWYFNYKYILDGIKNKRWKI